LYAGLVAGEVARGAALAEPLLHHRAHVRRAADLDAGLPLELQPGVALDRRQEARDAALERALGSGVGNAVAAGQEPRRRRGRDATRGGAHPAASRDAGQRTLRFARETATTRRHVVAVADHPSSLGEGRSRRQR
jgi:hypothetical protein